MSLSREEREALVCHRIQRSRETADDANLLFDNKKYLSAVNRIYYSMHHALYALALNNNYTTGKHGQLIVWFNRTYVKNRYCRQKIHSYYNKSF